LIIPEFCATYDTECWREGVILNAHMEENV